MSNDLVPTESGVPDALAVAKFRLAVNDIYRSIEKDRNGSDALPSLPSPVLRKELVERRKVLRSKLRQVSMASEEKKRATMAVVALLSGYLNARIEDVRKTADDYVTLHLMDQPMFAIIAAVDDFRNRRVFDIGSEGQRIPFTIDHAPSAFRLLDQVKKRASDVQSEHYQIGRILAVTNTTDMPLISKEESDQVGAALAQLAAGMTKRITKEAEEDRKRTRAEAQAARDRAQRIIQDAARRRAESEAASREQA